MNKLSWFTDIETEAKEILTADRIKIGLYNIIQMFKSQKEHCKDKKLRLREDDFELLKWCYTTNKITMYNLEDILIQWVADEIDIALANKAKKQKQNKGAFKVNFDSLSAMIGLCNETVMCIEIYTYSENYTYEEYLRKFAKLEMLDSNSLVAKNNERYAIYKNDETCTLEIHAYEIIMDYMGFSACTEEYDRVPTYKQIGTVRCGNLSYFDCLRSIELIEEPKETTEVNQINLCNLETETVYELHRGYGKLEVPVKKVIADIGFKTDKQITEVFKQLYDKVALIGEEVSREAKLEVVNKIIQYTL